MCCKLGHHSPWHTTRKYKWIYVVIKVKVSSRNHKTMGQGVAFRVTVSESYCNVYNTFTANVISHFVLCIICTYGCTTLNTVQKGNIYPYMNVCDTNVRLPSPELDGASSKRRRASRDGKWPHAIAGWHNRQEQEKQEINAVQDEACGNDKQFSLICDNIWGHTYHDEIWQCPYFCHFCM